MIKTKNEIYFFSNKTPLMMYRQYHDIFHTNSNQFAFQIHSIFNSIHIHSKKKKKRKQTCKSVNEICLNCSQVTISFFFTSFQSFLSTTLLVIAVVGSELFCFFRNCTSFLATRGPTPTQQQYLSMVTIELMYSDQAIDELTMETTFVTLVDRTSVATELNLVLF